MSFPAYQPADGTTIGGLANILPAVGSIDMELFFCGKESHNFGDFLNPWFWEQCLPGVLDEDPLEMVFGIGTILCSGKPMPARTERIHVLGSGYGYGDQEPDPRLRVWFVRGPRTAAKLNLDVSFAISDPAMLLPWFISSPQPVVVHKKAFIPHIGSITHCDWATPCSLAGIHLIDPRLPTLEFIASVRASRVILAESMHGAITADSFGVPWIPIISSSEILSFKWQDWLDTLQLDYRPHRIPQRIPLGWPRIRRGLRCLAEDLGLSKKSSRISRVSLFRWQPGNEICAEALLSTCNQPAVLSKESIRENVAERLSDRIHAFALFAKDQAARTGKAPDR